MTSRQLTNFFFSNIAMGEFKCNICDTVRRQAPSSGYSNLISHLAAKHPSHQLDYAEFQGRSLSPLEVFGFADEATTNMHDWMRWVVERSAPISDVKCKLTRALVKMRPTTPETLKRCMQLVAERVGKMIGHAMGTAFGLMYDGYVPRKASSRTTRFLCTAENRRREVLVGRIIPTRGGRWGQKRADVWFCPLRGDVCRLHGRYRASPAPSRDLPHGGRPDCGCAH
jgi:hypothetical protein